MKKLFTLLMAFVIFSSAVAQLPEKMSYQAVIRNESNILVTNHVVGIRISILQGSATGSIVYTETLTATTNANGLISVEIGGETEFNNIDWSEGPFFIKTETDPSGSSNYTIIGTSQLLSVPYAIYAKKAESITGLIIETDPVYSASQAANITADDITNLSNLSGTNTGDQDLNNLATKAALGDSSEKIRSEIPDVSKFISAETDPTWEGAANSTEDIGRTGNVGIGTVAPGALLNTLGTNPSGGNVIFEGLYKDTPGDPPVAGTGTFMMWYPDKAAFRAGYFKELKWNKDSIGDFSVSMGYNTRAKGYSSIALGYLTNASGRNSTALGNFSTASGYSSTALGKNTKASGGSSTSMGYSSIASGEYSTAMGYSSIASGDHSTAGGYSSTASGAFSTAMGRISSASGDCSVAMGWSAKASGDHSIALGRSAVASGSHSYAIGYASIASGDHSFAVCGSHASGTSSTAMGRSSNASGDCSTAMGRGTTASGYVATAMGIFTTASGEHSSAMGYRTTASGKVSTAMGNAAKAVGYNSFAINLNSKTGPDVGDSTFWISGANFIGGNRAWCNWSDLRLKKDIQMLNTEDNLAKIKQLNGVRFRWKDNDNLLNLGFIAQEVKDILPELVRYDERNDIYSMEYTAIIPVLVEGIKEQQKLIEAQESELKSLQEQINELHDLINNK